MNKIINNFKELARTNKIKATLVVIMLLMMSFYTIGGYAMLIQESSSIEEVLTFTVVMIIVIPLAITFWYNIITNRKFRNLMLKIGLISIIVYKYFYL